MRDYGIEGQLGLEPTFQEYIDKILVITKELKRILKPSGSFYLNMGDTYWRNNGHSGGYDNKHVEGVQWPGGNFKSGLIEKSLCFIPERLTIKMEDEQQWIPRSKIIWWKPNHMPSSVRDRLTNSWEYVYHFVKNKKYYYNLDAIRVPHTVCGVTDKRPMGVLRQKLYKGSHYNNSDDTHLTQYQGKFEGSEDPESFGSPRARTQRDKEMQKFFEKKGSGGNVNLTDRKYEQTDEIYGKDLGNRCRTRKHLDNRNEREAERTARENGKNPGDFWEITTQPMKLSHFATFPERLCLNPILSSCPPNGLYDCLDCGHSW